MLYLTRLEFTAQLERIGDSLGDMGEAKRERKIYTVQTDIFFWPFSYNNDHRSDHHFRDSRGLPSQIVDIVVIVRKAIC